jgi:protein tyrosine/serine phosphatase
MLDRTTPRVVRLATYALYDATVIAMQVIRSPLRVASYGRVLNLPRFSVVLSSRVFRSGEPRSRAHFAHVKELGVRTVVCVRGGGPSPATVAFAERYGLRLLVFDMGEEFMFDAGAAHAAALAALTPENQPALIHCDGGRHRAGMVCAIIRRRMGWSMPDVLNEYWTLAQPSPLACNVEFIVRHADGIG